MKLSEIEKLENKKGNLNEDLKFIKGIGEKRAEALQKSGINNIYDLILYFPTSYIDRESAGSVQEIRNNLENQRKNTFSIENNIKNQNDVFDAYTNYSLNKEVAIIGKIAKCQLKEFGNRRKMLILTLKDSKNENFEVLFFQMAEYFQAIYSVNKIISVSGKPTINENQNLSGKISFSHPEIDIIEAEDVDFYGKGGIIPKYKITEEMRKSGITIRILRNIMNNILSNLEFYKLNPNNLSFLNETLPNYLIEKLQLPNLKETIFSLHQPKTHQQIQAAKFRIKFEELFFYQLLINVNRAKILENENGILIKEKSKLARELYEILPFDLTSDQKKVLNEFAKDFASAKPMNRLLQGDVGSGKTIVAILTMLMIIDAGYQVIMMAPTELLAEQHFSTINNLINSSNSSNNSISEKNILKQENSNENISNQELLNDLEDFFNKKKKDITKAKENIENIENKVKTIKDLKVDILLGGMTKKKRTETLSKIVSGETDIIVGTHALFQKDLQYKNLGLVIIDEQHRFGVSQRAELVKLAKDSMLNNSNRFNNNSNNSNNSLNSFKNNSIQNEITKAAIIQNKSPHILYMTATPIPRTMTMTIYGDLDVSIIKSPPKNRLPIKTRVSFDSEREQVFDFVRKELQKNRQIYIVFPLVEKSEKIELKSAVEHFNLISEEIFPDYKCGLLHGQMKWNEKEEVMKSFKDNEFQILIATTVVEVGIDVPNATIMIIEDSERFGLSQLHQLRGRIGRGSEQSYCFLMTKDNFKFKFSGKKSADFENEKINSIIRLKAMQETSDGFKLSEIDLKLRGPGDILGTKQSGLPVFKYADLINDLEIVQISSKIAKEITKADLNLEKSENQILKQNLEKYLLENNNFINIA
jgi:ATP-dependent DNA helicase RecG